MNNFLKTFKSNKYRLRENKYSGLLQFLFILFFSIALTGLVLALQPGYLHTIIVLSKQSKMLMPFLNFLPIFFMALLLYYLTNNMNIASSITYIIFSNLTYVNRGKILFRNEPFTPTDFKLGKEAFVISKTTNYEFDYRLFAYLVILFILMNLFVYVINFGKAKKVFRILVPSLVIISAIILYPTLYKSKEVWKNLPHTGSAYNVTSNYKDKGIVYSFIHNIGANGIKKPDNFNFKEMKELDARPIDKLPLSANQKPLKCNVVVIMGEAFADISRSDFFTFNKEEDDPMRYYKKLESESLMYGHIVVSGFGGGTANTEYDVLTGCPTTMLNDTTIPSFYTVREPLSSVTSVLKNNGYKSVGVHPGHDWFYNRRNVYEHLGFDKSLFNTDFENPKILAGFISEDDTSKKLVDLYNNADNNTPFFEYCVTIQNHGPYTPDKYPDRDINYNFTCKEDVSEEVFSTYAVYFEGIRDMDEQMHELSEIFKKNEEPVIFAYYGDHLPYLLPNNGGFNEMNYGLTDDLDGLLKLYSVPYFVWANDKAKMMFDKEKIAELAKLKGKHINASFVGTSILDLLNMADENKFLSYVNDLKNNFYVIQRDFVVENENGKAVLKNPDELSEEKSKIYNEYKNYIYYHLKYNN